MSGKLIYKRVKGPMDNYEDWYYLYQTEAGPIVRHEWSHVSPSLSQNHGSKDYSIQDFMVSDEVHTAAKVELRKLHPEA